MAGDLPRCMNSTGNTADRGSFAKGAYVSRCERSVSGIRILAAVMLVSCWASFVIFLVVSHSFRRFCFELSRLVAKVL